MLKINENIRKQKQKSDSRRQKNRNINWTENAPDEKQFFFLISLKQSLKNKQTLSPTSDAISLVFESHTHRHSNNISSSGAQGFGCHSALNFSDGDKDPVNENHSRLHWKKIALTLA